LLAILTAGLAAGQTTILDLAAWAQEHVAELIAQLQLNCPRIPSAATLRRVPRDADAESRPDFQGQVHRLCSCIVLSVNQPADRIQNRKLSFDGSVRHIYSLLPMADAAKEMGYEAIYMPQADAPEAAQVEGDVPHSRGRFEGCLTVLQALLRV
jgi:hypothetical protein